MRYMLIIHFIIDQKYPIVVIKRLVDRTASCTTWEYAGSQGDEHASTWTGVRLEDAQRCRPRQRRYGMVSAAERIVGRPQGRTTRREARHPQRTLGRQARSDDTVLCRGRSRDGRGTMRPLCGYSGLRPRRIDNTGRSEEHTS